VRVHALLLALVAVSCSAATTKDRVLPTGTWGGDDVQVIVTSQGATLQFACSHGAIHQPIEPDANGNFSATGTYVYEHPANPLSEADSHSARFDGQFSATTMRVTVTVPDKQDVFGPFTATLGATGPRTRCP